MSSLQGAIAGQRSLGAVVKKASNTLLFLLLMSTLQTNQQLNLGSQRLQAER